MHIWSRKSCNQLIIQPHIPVKHAYATLSLPITDAAPCTSWSTKQATNRQTWNRWHFYNASEELGICYLFLETLRILCCSAGVTAIGGSKSRSSICFGCSAVVFDPVVSQHKGFPNFVGCLSPCVHIPCRTLVDLLHQARQVDLRLSAGNGCFAASLASSYVVVIKKLNILQSSTPIPCVFFFLPPFGS